ncbi:SlyX family protein [Nibricoccus sp. IMCC34717]|uniref:SlyX family protein n=1 Tax=Nibricoccus sp. IMCC34717 TaxID=3034021 RepID=UPI00384A5901
MSDAHEIRLARLEERLAWFERHVAEQDKVILELTETLALLRKETLRLRDRVEQAPGDDADERPPHY